VKRLLATVIIMATVFTYGSALAVGTLTVTATGSGDMWIRVYDRWNDPAHLSPLASYHIVGDRFPIDDPGITIDTATFTGAVDVVGSAVSTNTVFSSIGQFCTTSVNITTNIHSCPSSIVDGEDKTMIFEIKSLASFSGCTNGFTPLTAHFAEDSSPGSSHGCRWSIYMGWDNFVITDTYASCGKMDWTFNTPGDYHVQHIIPNISNDIALMLRSCVVLQACTQPVQAGVIGSTISLYSDIPAAYLAATNDFIIALAKVPFNESFTLDKDITLTLEGNRDCDGYPGTETTITGLTITAGTLIADSVVII